MIELSGPHEPKWQRNLAKTPVLLPVEVPRSRELPVCSIDEIVDTDEVVCQREQHARISRWQPAKPGHGTFDHEPTAWTELTRRVLEAGHLFVLSREVHNRVEDQVDERELDIESRRSHVAFYGADATTVRLCKQPGQHVGGQFDAENVKATAGEWNRNTPGPYGELEYRPTSGQLGKTVHCRGQNLVREHAGERFVIRACNLTDKSVLGHRYRSLVQLPLRQQPLFRKL